MLARLSDSQFATFLQEVRGKRAFEADPARVDALTSALELDQAADTAVLLAGCEFLYDRAYDWTADNRDAADATRDLLQFAGLWPRSGEHSDIVLQRLSAVLRRNPIRDQALKRRWLQTGILDVPTSFSSFVDLRPNFTADRLDISELVPVVIFNIMLQTEDGDEHSCTFQLSEYSLKRLEDAISDVRLKLSRLRDNTKLSPFLFRSSASENRDE